MESIGTLLNNTFSFCMEVRTMVLRFSNTLESADKVLSKGSSSSEYNNMIEATMMMKEIVDDNYFQLLEQSNQMSNMLYYLLEENLLLFGYDEKLFNAFKLFSSILQITIKNYENTVKQYNTIIHKGECK